MSISRGPGGVGDAFSVSGLSDVNSSSPPSQPSLEALDPSNIFAIATAPRSSHFAPVHPDRVLKMVAGLKAFEAGGRLYEELSQLCRATGKQIAFVHDTRIGRDYFAFLPGFLCISCPQDERKEFRFIGLDTQNPFNEAKELDTRAISLVDENIEGATELVETLHDGRTVEGFCLGHELSHAGIYLDALSHVKNECENTILAACAHIPLSAQNVALEVNNMLHNKFGPEVGLEINSLATRIESIVNECSANGLSPESATRYITDKLIGLCTAAIYQGYQRDWSRLGLSEFDLMLCPSLPRTIKNVEEARNIFLGTSPTGERAFLRELNPNWVRIAHTEDPRKIDELKFDLKFCFDLERDKECQPITSLILHGTLPFTDTTDQSESDSRTTDAANLILQNYTLRNVPNDGDCGIRAVLEQLPEASRPNMEALRANAASRIPEIDDALGQEVVEQRQRIANAGHWLAVEDFQYIAQAIGQPIVVITDVNDTLNYYRFGHDPGNGTIDGPSKVESILDSNEGCLYVYFQQRDGEDDAVRHIQAIVRND